MKLFQKGQLFFAITLNPICIGSNCFFTALQPLSFELIPYFITDILL